MRSNSPLQPASAATALAAERLIRWAVRLVNCVFSAALGLRVKSLTPSLVACGVLLASCGGQRAPEVEPRVVAFEDLPDWYSGDISEMPPAVAGLVGKRIQMTGVLIAIGGNEALLVPGVTRSGCSVQVPGIEQSVRVRLPEAKPAVDGSTRVRVTGAFAVSETLQDGFCLDIYQMQADTVQVVR